MVLVAPVTLVMTVADDLLVMAALISSVLCPVFFRVPVRPLFIHHHFISGIEIETPVTLRQVSCKYPAAAGLIYILPSGHIVEHIEIRDIIIFNMIVTRRAPNRLGIDIEPQFHPDLSIGGLKTKCSKYQRGQ